MTTPNTWLITGASRGLGLALAERVLAAGHRVVATSRQGALPIRHPRLTVARLDPADGQQCRRVIEEARALTGSLDVLVNNAGYGLVGAAEEISEEQARAIVDVDLLGPLWLAQAALPIMRDQGHGHIVQVSSTGGVGAMPMLGLYNAAKWGLEGFSEALAGEVQPMGIRVTLVEVSQMDTHWATSGMQFSAPNAAYDQLRKQLFGTSTVPWTHEPEATGGGTPPEDIADGIMAHVAAGDGPLRLVLGEGAADQISTVLDQRRQEYENQPGLTRRR